MEYIDRKYEKAIEERFRKGKAIVIYGPRQVGKSTLVKHIIEKGKLNPLYINGDSSVDRDVFATTSLSMWKLLLGEKDSLFIDEAQKIPNMAEAVKILIDSNINIPIFITSSSSFALYASTKESLTGRKYEYKLLPFSFSELSNKYGLFEERKNLEQRLIFGSYPEIVDDFPNAKENLELLSDSYLFKDLFELEGVRKPEALRKLIKALAYRVGSMVSTNELASLIGYSKTLVDSYLTLLEDAFIIFKLGSYSTNLRNELKKSTKYYFWDNGIRNSIINDFSPLNNRQDIGLLWENYLVSERIKRNLYNKSKADSFFWRTSDKYEIDYIEQVGDRIEAYEFKWNPRKSSSGAKAFNNRYSDILVNMISRDNYYDFLLN